MSMKSTILTLTLLAIFGTVLLLGACNTTAGAGQDLSKAGKAIETTAKKNTPN